MPKYKRGHNNHICHRTTTRIPRVGKRPALRAIGDSDQTSQTDIIGSDINGHVGMNGIESTLHGNIGLGERNEEGYRLEEFANMFDLVIANTWFTKTRNQLITLKTGNSGSQIDYILTKRRHLKDIINCKTIPGEVVVSQHRLTVMELRTRTRKKRQYRRENEVKIKWWRLEDRVVAEDYANDVINNMADCEEPEWTIFSETMKEKGSEHCGVTTGGKSMQKRETWWCNTTVQQAIDRKKRMFKTWQQSIESTRRSCCLQREKQREPQQLSEQEQHNNCLGNWTLEKAKRLSIGWQNIETRQPKITSKLTL